MTTDLSERCLTFFAHRCAYCGVAGLPLTRDHFIPLARGGGHGEPNIVPACWRCNSAKADAEPLGWCHPTAHAAILRYFASCAGPMFAVAGEAEWDRAGWEPRDRRSPKAEPAAVGAAPPKEPKRATWHIWFRGALGERRIEQAQLARQLGIGKGLVLAYWLGTVTPPEKVRQRIEAALATSQGMTG